MSENGLPLLYQKLTPAVQNDAEHMSPGQTHQPFSIGGQLSQPGSYAEFPPQTNGFGGMPQNGTMVQPMYDTSHQYMDYNFSYGGPQMYSSGAIELDHMCVPSPMAMETIGEYTAYP